MAESLMQLLENVALVVVIVYFYAFIRKKIGAYPKFITRSFIGITFGLMALLAMQTPIIITEGVRIDARVVLCTLAGYFGGPISGFFSALITSIYRLYLGGDGDIAGVVNTFLSSGVGVAFYYMKDRFSKERNLLIIMGGAVSVLAMLSVGILPSELRLEALRGVVIPVVILYPIGILAYGTVISHEENRYTMEQELLTLNKDLEKEVALRTREVEAINKGLIEEIRYRKETELALKEAEQCATAANKMKSDFLANMSHEIRTPLNAIIGYTHLLSKTQLNEKQDSFLSKMDSSSGNLLNIVNDILDFSKIEAGKLDLLKKPVNLFGMINSLLDTVNYEAHKKHLYISVHIGDGIPEWIVGDDGRINQILLNIMSNAVKFTHRGGVSIVLALNEEEPLKNKIDILIKDTGIGVKKEQAKAIFDEFTQANMSINREFGGTGLGLAITKRLVDMMDGSIWFNSEYGKGTVVKVSIPIEKSHQRIRHIEESMKIALITGQVDRSSSLFHQLKRMGADVKVIQLIDQLHADEEIDYVLVDWEQQYTQREVLFALIRERVGHSVPIDIMSYYRDRDLQKFVEDKEEGSVLFLPQSSDNLISFINKKWVDVDHSYTLEERSYMGMISGKKILIVEDNPLNQDIERTIIEDKGGNVVIASNGKEAVELAQRGQFDLILMDIHMPIMDGYDAARAIRAMDMKQYIPIIAMTADVQVGVEDMIREAGMDDYVKKPINVMNVYKILSKWL